MLVVEITDELAYNVLAAFHDPSAMRVLPSSPNIDMFITDVGLPGGINSRPYADAALSLLAGLKTCS